MVDDQEIMGRIIDRVSDQAGVIVSAHLALGIPLEDLICAAVRRAASLKAIEAGQGELDLGMRNADGGLRKAGSERRGK
jgi:predicted amidohydrolase